MKVFNSISFKNVKINDGFWKLRQDINASTTAHSVYDRFCDSHRFEALACNWHEGDKDMPHIFWDSDVAKWIEGAAYIIEQNGDNELKALCENAIDTIIQNQAEDGYFNSHFLVTEKENRFKDRGNHELYCAGHLFEAAVAYYHATGEDKFLKAMCRFADYIYDTFYVYQTAAFTTCGHPEIELALIRLYDATQNEKYLTLAKFFIDKHGANQKDKSPYDWVNEYYAQDQAPLKEQRSAEGHSVRAMYLYCAMSDIARIFNDEEYKTACEAIFDNATTKKMYVTGGIGSTDIGEAFATDYYLPNAGSYTETCAAISLALFAHRMQLISDDSKYADIIERVIYNGFLSGVSLDGTSFFYENPLEIDPFFADVNTSTKYKRHVPIRERVHLFECSCCPPNVLRFIASIGDMLYTENGETLFVHQFMQSTATINGAKITLDTCYPKNGNIKISMSGGNFKQIAVRIPCWCDSFTADKSYTMKNGYAYFDSASEINICFDMAVKLYESNVYVQNNAGRCAVTRGPIVYCMEEVDNGKHLKSISISLDSKFIEEDTEYIVPNLITSGKKRKESTELYSIAGRNLEDTEIKFVPYFTFANRGDNEMLVWVMLR